MASPYSYSASTPGRQLTEEQRRRLLLNKKLSQELDDITPEEYDRRLEEQKRQLPIGAVDQVIGYVPTGAQDRDRRPGSEAQVTDAMERSKSRLGRRAQQQLTQAEQRAVIQSGRDPSQVGVTDLDTGGPPVPEGMYYSTITGQWERDVFGKRFKDRVIPRYKSPTTEQQDQLELQIRKEAVREFGNFRQKLTQNYQRLDPFAKMQYNEMNKRIQGLYNAKSSGKVSTSEFLRGMEHLSDTAKQLDWDQHMLPKGANRGEISTNELGVRMIQGEKGPELFGYTNEYVERYTQDLGNGRRLVPIVKNGKPDTLLLEAGETIHNFKERREAQKEYKDLVQDYYQKRIDEHINQKGVPPTEDQYKQYWQDSRIAARTEIKNIRDDMDSIHDPYKPDPDDPDPLDPNPRDLEAAAAAEEQGRQDGMEIARKEHEEVNEEIIDQVMNKFQVGRRQAEQIAVDDVKIRKFENAPGLAEYEQYRSLINDGLPEVDPERNAALNGRINKYKSKIKQERVRAAYFEDDPELKHRFDNPIPYRFKRKKEVGQVYAVSKRDGKGYDRIYILPNGQGVKLVPWWEREEKEKKERIRRGISETVREFGPAGL